MCYAGRTWKVLAVKAICWRWKLLILYCRDLYFLEYFSIFLPIHSIDIVCYNIVLCFVQKFPPRNRWQTPSKATVAQLTCLETNWHLEGMHVNFLISATSHVTCSICLRFLSCIEETKICQAPGNGSFLENVIVWQVYVRNRLVHFQCFGKGLWTKTMANHAKAENLQRSAITYSLAHYHTNERDTTWFHCISQFQTLQPQTPMPSTRPLLLHYQ